MVAGACRLLLASNWPSMPKHHQAARWAVGTYALGTALATENDRISVLPPNTVALSVAASLKSAATAVREAIPTPPGAPP